MIRLAILSFCLCSSLLGCCNASEIDDNHSFRLNLTTRETGTIEDRGNLLRDLLTGYDTRNYPSNTTTRFSVSLLKFNVDEHEGNVVTADIWLREIWTDPRLAFDPSKYGGISILRIPRKEVWTPDIMLYNAESGPDGLECVDTNVLVYSNGMVLGVPPCTIRAYCGLTLDTEPYGEQLCTLRFGSWTLDGHTMDIRLYQTDEGEMEYYQKNPNWEVTTINASREEKYYPCCKEPYITINFDLAFHRVRT